RILHLLPVHPTPTTFARFGRFGSPYACQDLLAVDPALVAFDRRTTGLDQFRELAQGVHAREGRLFLDIVINHTGWGSTLWENRPDWFERQADGSFKSPGAWGNTWEDLVELRHDNPGLRRYIADALLEWCRRGVDGFRCDAGYMVPLDAWRYIIARVRQEFPDTVFLLEGLGGAWAATESLLAEGNMQWAYSELFQNHSGAQVAWYLDYALARSRDRGLYVHYSETHDNARLGAKGRAWSLLRNRLCALTSVSGGFGFTCGVEWLAAEQVNVHSSRGLSWGNRENLIPELQALNRLLAEHPCFLDGATLTRLSGEEDPVFVLRRVAAGDSDVVLVLVNTDTDQPRKCRLEAASLREAGLLDPKDAAPHLLDLLGQDAPVIRPVGAGRLESTLAPGAAFCLARQRKPVGQGGAAYRARRAREAFALIALGRLLPVERLGELELGRLGDWLDREPEAFLAAVARAGEPVPGSDSPELPALSEVLQPGGADYPQVVRWERGDARRVTPWPGNHWLLVVDDAPFRAVLKRGDVPTPERVESTPFTGGHLAAFWPGAGGDGEAALEMERYGTGDARVTARFRLLSGMPRLETPAVDAEIALLTNGVGGMARLPVDFGVVRSKYDCLLGANLHPRVPVDRHVLAKRARLWVNTDGFISPLDARNLVSFEAGPPARWRFRAHAGDGRTAEIEVEAAMPAGRNTTVLRFHRPSRHATTSRDLPPAADVRLTVRVDVEDRNFHQETKHNPGADHHFRSRTQTLARQPGFEFRPAPDRRLRVFCDAGRFHAQPEWCFNIPHPVEQSRGQEGSGDAFSPGWFELPLPGGAQATLVITAEAERVPVEVEPPGKDEKVHSAAEPGDRFEAVLRRACEAFVVRRDAGKTVIAGYPWFLDWGRDTLICARGLLAAGMQGEVLDSLKIFGRFEENGTLPNAIHGENAANRETVDAPLWYGLVCEELAALAGPGVYATCVEPGGRPLSEVIRSIAAGYLRGTPNG
ncbi:MAG: glycogen debranching enzyme N-terminal domain-containing protein, partial [Verrucomicrobiae bacterium]|nr:glycogen debranching enzyme N-terminal domain-containing protein [Verrucomicrobiae bacterium]